MIKKCGLQFESLENRVVFNAGPVGLLQYDGVQDWNWHTAAETQIIRPNLLDNVPGWNPAIIDDFTGDGVPDALGTQIDSGTWRLQSNSGTEVFQEWASPPIPDANFVTTIDTADFNNDGLLDILSWNELSGEIWVSVNSFVGLSHQLWTTFAPAAVWQELIVDDFDGDGYVDLLGGESSGSWWLAKNNLGQGFLNHHWGSFPQYDWTEVVSGDFSGDGLPDVAARDPNNTWWVWQGATDQLLPATYWGHWKMSNSWSDVRVADFDDDGRDDLIGRSEDGYLYVGSSVGSNRFHTWSWGSGWIANANWTNTTVADLNDDGRLDYVGKAAGGTWWYAENQGDRFYNHFWLKAPEAPFEQIVVGFYQGTSRPPL